MNAWQLITVLTLLGTSARLAAQPPTEPTWPCWRGLGSQGVALESRLPVDWPRGPLVPRWQAAVGDGWSSPVVAGNVLVVTDRIDNAERVLAFDSATGRELWKQSHPVDFDPHAVGQRHGNGPKSTPVIHQGRVYALGIAGRLQCLDARDGRIVWEHDLPAEFGARIPLPGGRAYVDREECVYVPVGNGEAAPVPLFGYTGSPTVEGELLIVPVGGARAGTIVAFHKDTGKPVWHALQEHVSYSSPVVATLAGVRQIVVMTGPRVVGLSVAEGQLLWSFPYQVQYDESIGTPAIGDDTVVVTATGYPLTGLRVARQEGRWSCTAAWRNDDLTSYLSSFLVHEGHVYGMNDGGEFGCVRLGDGHTLWTGGHHGYYCTPVLAGGQLLGLNERGELLVLAAQPRQYQERATLDLAGHGTWTSPAVVGSRIYVRSGSDVRCFDFDTK